jgi:phosphoribosylanthranilate isomerase
MTVTAKICGINDALAMRTAVEGGASHVGLVFYPPSPRSVTPAAAAELAEIAGTRAVRTGLFVDPDDALIDDVLSQVPLDLLQLHGKESPERVATLGRRAGRPVMKAIRVGSMADIDGATA